MSSGQWQTRLWECSNKWKGGFCSVLVGPLGKNGRVQDKDGSTHIPINPHAALLGKSPGIASFGVQLVVHFVDCGEAGASGTCGGMGDDVGRPILCHQLVAGGEGSGVEDVEGCGLDYSLGCGVLDHCCGLGEKV